MLGTLLFLFICIPLLELFILIKMGSAIGVWPTIFIQIATGFIGANLARFQGFFILKKIQEDLHQGRLPANELVDGVLVLGAGIVLLTPGLITDVLGLLILFPVTRYGFKRWVQRKFAAIQKNAAVDVVFHHDSAGNGQVIDGRVVDRESDS